MLARASFGPETHAQAANLTCANHVPVQRAAGLMSQMAGVTVSAGWVAGFTNNEAERTIRPVKVQRRSSRGCWRTIEGLADFAVIQSYLSTAAKWGISKLGALRDLFNGHAWMPSRLEPSG